MRLNWFISKRLSESGFRENGFSRPVIRIALGGIILGMIVMILTIFIVKGFQTEVRERAVAFGSHIQIFKNSDNNSAESLPVNSFQPELAKWQKDQRVKHVQSYILKNGIIKTKNENEGVLVKGVGNKMNWGFVGQHIVEGSTFQNDTNTSEFPLLISSVISNRMELKTKDKVILYFLVPDTSLTLQFEDFDTTLKISDPMAIKARNKELNPQPEMEFAISFLPRSRAFRVSGIYETGLEDFDKKMVFTSERALQKIYRWPENTTGGFELLLHDFEEVDETAEEIYFSLSGKTELTAYTIKEQNPGIFEWLDMHDTTAWIVLILMVIVSVINMTSALIILIIEKVNFIGVLKALGMNNKNLTAIFLFQAAKIIGKGMFIGNCVGLTLAWIQHQFHWIKLDQSVYYMPYIPIKFVPEYWILLNAGTFLLCMVFMIFPAILVSRTSPVKAIKFA